MVILGQDFRDKRGCLGGEKIWRERERRDEERRGCFLLKIEFLRENEGFENLATDRTVERGLGKRLGGFGF